MASARLNHGLGDGALTHTPRGYMYLLEEIPPGGIEEPMDETTKKRLIGRLKRAEGQLAAVRRMVEEDTYCVDVLTQVSAVRGALARIGHIILDHHVRSCVAHAFDSGDEEERIGKLDELMDVFGRYGGSGGG